MSIDTTDYYGKNNHKTKTLTKISVDKIVMCNTLGCNQNAVWKNSKVKQYNSDEYKTFNYCTKHAKEIKNDWTVNTGGWERI